jgi:adenylosuccinate synthase
MKDRYNPGNVWQRELRSGWLDLPLLRYAREVNGPVDGLAVTHTDSLDRVRNWLVCTQYKFQDGKDCPLIKLKNPTIGAQEKLGKMLGDLTFEVESVPHNLILSRLEDALQASVKIISAGPCAKDKLFL